MDSGIKQKIEEILKEYPIYQYGFLKTEQVEWKEEVRRTCSQECDRYGKSWSCPPGVGTVEVCRNRCMKFSDVMVFSTLAEVTDASDLKETLDTRKEHEEVVYAIRGQMQEAGEMPLALSSESCAICQDCSYPAAPCRYPDKMLPCIESYGILVISAIEKLGMDFFYDSGTILWFGMIIFHRRK